MSTRQVEFLETVRLGTQEFHGPDPENGREHGDRVTLPKKLGDLAVNSGWAKDAITGESGERRPGAVAVRIDNVRQPGSTTTPAE